MADVVPHGPDQRFVDRGDRRALERHALIAPRDHRRERSRAAARDDLRAAATGAHPARLLVVDEPAPVADRERAAGAHAPAPLTLRPAGCCGSAGTRFGTSAGPP